MIIDLHTHSSASDGAHSPKALIEEAAATGVGALALTDHDTIDGLDEAEKAARTAGISFIRGVELEIDWPEIGTMERREFHLLGLGFGTPSAKLRRILFQLQHKREKRNRLILERMHAAGIDADMDEIRPAGVTSYIGRPHFAAYLIKKKVVKDTEEAFKKYLSKDMPLYVPKGGIRLRRAISAIKESGGLAILAHPISLYIAWGRLPGILERFKNSGLDGIEVYHPTATARSNQRLLDMAQQLNLAVSAGSDFHGDRPDRRLGESSGRRAITSDLIQFPPEILAAWGIHQPE
ncbi:MAG: PHP domain-containing protein [Spirochaetaceae bacterium]|nr:PHP domain-containing protein [Spirochaetaceae bacterium]